MESSVNFLSAISSEQLCWRSTELRAAGRKAALDHKYVRTTWNALDILELVETNVTDIFHIVLHRALMPNSVMRRFAVQVVYEMIESAKLADLKFPAVLNAALAFERKEIAKEELARVVADLRYHTDTLGYFLNFPNIVKSMWLAVHEDAADAAWSVIKFNDSANSETKKLLKSILDKWLNEEDVLEGTVWGPDRKSVPFYRDR